MGYNKSMLANKPMVTCQNTFPGSLGFLTLPKIYGKITVPQSSVMANSMFPLRVV